MTSSQAAPPKVQTYRVTGETSLQLHIYLPTGPHTGAAIIFFYGGGWQNGDIEQFAPQSRYFSERGLTAVCAEYRVANQHGTTPFDALEDAVAALEWLQARADDFNFAPERLIAAGGSAGGHLALCAALFGRVQSGALVLFNPVLDTSETGFGFELFSGRGLELSPLHHVRKGLPPTLVLQGAADTTTPLATAQQFCEAMRAAGNHCEVESYSGEGHGFFNSGRGDGRSFDATLRRSETFLETLGYLKGGL